jgi:hypothetical protein
MPCLNEVDLIADAIASLGFSEEAVPSPDTHLIVVDNGSTDGTLHLLEGVQSKSKAPVHVISEPIRGFVPPRRRGVTEAQIMAHALGIAENDVLILQVDADTIYRQGYVKIMRGAASNTAGVILEGSTKPPPDFALAHPTYLLAQRLVDDQTDPLNAEDEEEIVLDDKVCGYRLSDYLSWGGLFEEHTVAGDAMHAETTRMFIRARLRHGARKLRVNPAGAMPSRRKIFENPWLQYATVGFPREASWIRAPRAQSPSEYDVDSFSSAILDGQEPTAEYLRRAHQLALFRYLPALIAEIDGTKSRIEQPTDITAALASLPTLSAEKLTSRPGCAIFNVLELIDTRPELFCIP